VPTQARELNEQLGTICFQSYLMPTFFLHTTDWGITKQTKQHPNGMRELHNEGSESYYAHRAIIFGATLITHLADATTTFYATGETERKAIEQAVETITKELIGNVGIDISEEDTAT
jgi:hypothetical protein